jgi:Ca2+-binding EF-hand superfamily protein
MNKIKVLAILSGCAVALGAGLAAAQVDGPAQPDGPMQGLMHGHERLSTRFFGKFDLNHDGKVTHDELNRVDGARFAQVTHRAGGMTKEQFASLHLAEFQQHTAQMFRRLDWNGDGKLSLEEYASPMRVRFETMDRDGTGSESCAADPAQSIQHAGYSGRFHHGFGRAHFCAENDLNGDGRVTHAEFDQATAKRFSAATSGAKAMNEDQFAADALKRYQEMSGRMFDRLDANHDGKLSLAEFAAMDQKLFARLDKNHDGAITADEMSFHGGGHGRWHRSNG